MILDDHEKVEKLASVCDTIDASPEECCKTKQDWKWEKMKDEPWPEWPLMFLEDIANFYGCSLVNLIKEIGGTDQKSNIRKS